MQSRAALARTARLIRYFTLDVADRAARRTICLLAGKRAPTPGGRN